MNEKFKVNLNEYLPLRDVVFNFLREAILSGELMPGERLMENQLAERIGVSRTPIREAIRKLELEGLVEMVPRKGAQVASMTKKGIKDVLEVRSALEELAVRLACERIVDEQILELKAVNKEFSSAVENRDIQVMVDKDVEFHDIIFKVADNNKLTQIISNLREQIHRYRIVYLNDKVYLQTIKDEHNEIISAIEKRDAAAAGATIIKHIINQEKAVVKSLK
jgi:DNA-binding GntR family transcriptional regulator